MRVHEHDAHVVIWTGLTEWLQTVREIYVITHRLKLRMSLMRL